MERVVTGLQKRRVVTEKEKRILAYHEAGHALMAHLMGDLLPVQKVTIVGRGDALGLTYYLPAEDRYLHTKEELDRRDEGALAGRAAEQVVFGRVTNGAANDLERVTSIARAWSSSTGCRRSLRPARCAPTTTRCRRRRSACATASRLGSPTTRTKRRSGCCASTASALDRLAAALLEKETLDRDELDALLSDVTPESRSSETVGTVRARSSDAVRVAAPD